MTPEEAAKILGCTVTSSAEEISRLFRRAAIKCHPDKAGGTEAEFVRLNKAYEALVGEKKKNEGKITEDALSRFRKMYEGSEEEKEELMLLYKKYKGNLSRIIDHMILGEDEQEKRYRSILNPLIEKEELPRHTQYEKSPLNNKRRQEKRKREAEQAAALAAELKKRESRRKDEWDEMIHRLEGKVSVEKKGRNK